IAEFLHGHGIIEILRVRTVDGDGELIPQIRTPHELGGFYRLRHLFSFFQHLFRKVDFDAVLIDDRQYIHTGIVLVAEDLDDMAFRIIFAFAVFRDFHKHFVASTAPRFCFFGMNMSSMIFWESGITNPKFLLGLYSPTTRVTPRVSMLDTEPSCLSLSSPARVDLCTSTSTVSPSSAP